MNTAKADRCFEISFEVANKIGGIYTVISSKARVMKDLYADYLLIGPYVHDQAIHEIDRIDVPPHLQEAVRRVREKGIIIHIGRWNVAGRPLVALIDYKDFFYKENELKAWYWERYGIDSLGKGYEFSEPMIFSTAAGLFIEDLIRAEPHKRSVVHCHEWMAGFCGLHLKAAGTPCGFVFTTHATMLGRTYSSHGHELYSSMDHIDAPKEARRLNIQEKHGTECACAQHCDVLTTVSETTAMECERFLGRKPDLITPNGLDLRRFLHHDALSLKRHLIRQDIQSFNACFFGPYEPVAFDDAVFFYTSGRYEYHNKGIGLLLDSLGQLNKTLKEEGKKTTVYCYILVPTATKGIKERFLQSRALFSEIRERIRKDRFSMEQHLLRSVVNDTDEEITASLMKKELDPLRRRFHEKREEPLMATHTTVDEADNLILDACRRHGLQNRAEDKVKIIYGPFYLSPHDNIFNLHYYAFTSGCDLGIFPSRYEPFGYTPLESLAVSVPAITTDASGFGRHVKELQKENSGLGVIERMQVNCEDCANQLCEKMKKFLDLDEDQRARRRYDAYETSRLLDWPRLIEHYVQAHERAIEKAFPDTFS